MSGERESPPTPSHAHLTRPSNDGGRHMERSTRSGVEALDAATLPEVSRIPASCRMRRLAAQGLHLTAREADEAHTAQAQPCRRPPERDRGR